MGNGQSSSGTSIPSSMSFLSSKKSSDTKTKGKVIVVRQGTSSGGITSYKDDDIMKRFSEIPKFYPVLRGALNQSGLRDPPETIFKISARPILKFAYCLQEHLSHCANTTAVEQESLMNKMKDIDHTISLLLIQYSNRKKTLDRFKNNLEKIGDLQAHVSNLRFLFQDLIPIAETLNEILPEERRLPVLNIHHLIEESMEEAPNVQRYDIVQNTNSDQSSSIDNNQDNFYIKPIYETTVIDQSDV